MRGALGRTLVLTLGFAPGCASSPPPSPEAPAEKPAGTLSPAPVIRESTAEHRPHPTNPPNAEPGARERCQADSIRAAHILVAWGGALRASTAEPVASRKKEQALVRIQEVLAKARAGADFATLVKTYSDEPGAAEREGKLGSFGRNRMVKPFEEAAFALCPGEVSGVVETPFGYHVIMRTE
jgi:hypothetical protein